jgi:hypothetical protein
MISAPAAGGGHPDAADVVVEVEVGILHPHRVVELERHLDEPPGERRDEVEAAADVLLDGVERVAPRHGRRVVDARHGHVHVAGRRLQIQERRVHAAQTLHPITPLIEGPIVVHRDRRRGGGLRAGRRVWTFPP